MKVIETRGALGKRGEAAAEEYLSSRGMRLLARNWRAGRAGEVDLIFRDGETTVFVEVKTRTSADSLEVVDRHKLARLRRLAAAWLRAEPGWSECRIDVVAVIVPSRPVEEDFASAAIHWWKGVDQ